MKPDQRARLETHLRAEFAAAATRDTGGLRPPGVAGLDRYDGPSQARPGVSRRALALVASILIVVTIAVAVTSRGGSSTDDRVPAVGPAPGPDASADTVPAIGGADTVPGPATPPVDCRAFLAPPFLIDGSDPGDAAMPGMAYDKVAIWGDYANHTMVMQAIDGGVDITELFEMVEGTSQLIVGPNVRAAVVPDGDPPLGGITIAIDGGGCVREYSLGEGHLLSDAIEYATRWVDALDQ